MQETGKCPIRLVYLEKIHLNEVENMTCVGTNTVGDQCKKCEFFIENQKKG